MAIRWKNIKSGEELVADTEPQIAALLNSSDHSPNAYQGQDFGWRLAPAVAVELKKIKQDFSKIAHIAQLFSKAPEDIRDSDVLKYISDRTAIEAAPVADVSDYQDEYDAEIRRLEAAGQKPAGFDQEESVSSTIQATTTESTTTTTTVVPPETDSATTTTTEAPAE